MKFKLPQVHIAVNVSGLLAGLGSAAAFIVANPNATLAFGVPERNVSGIVAIAGLIAAFLPTKKSSPDTTGVSASSAVPPKSLTLTDNPAPTEGNK